METVARLPVTSLSWVSKPVSGCVGSSCCQRGLSGLAGLTTQAHRWLLRLCRRTAARMSKASCPRAQPTKGRQSSGNLEACVFLATPSAPGCGSCSSHGRSRCCRAPAPAWGLLCLQQKLLRGPPHRGKNNSISTAPGQMVPWLCLCPGKSPSYTTCFFLDPRNFGLVPASPASPWNSPSQSGTPSSGSRLPCRLSPGTQAGTHLLRQQGHLHTHGTFVALLSSLVHYRSLQWSPWSRGPRQPRHTTRPVRVLAILTQVHTRRPMSSAPTLSSCRPTREAVTASGRPRPPLWGRASPLGSAGHRRAAPAWTLV